MQLKPLFSLIATSALALSLSACNVYHMPIQQGNIVTAKMAQKLHKGMSRQQLLASFGPPVLITPYKSNKEIYVYTLKPTSGRKLYRKLVITLVNSRITSHHLTTR